MLLRIWFQLTGKTHACGKGPGFKPQHKKGREGREEKNLVLDSSVF